MNVTIPVYARREAEGVTMCTLGLGRHNLRRWGPSELRVERTILDELTRVTSQLSPKELARFRMLRGIRLEHVDLELSLRGHKRRRITGELPIVVEPRWASEDTRLVIAFHPLRPSEWFPVSEGARLAEVATTFFERSWAELEDAELSELVAPGRDFIRPLSFLARPRSLLDLLPAREPGVWDDLELDRSPRDPSTELRVLPSLGVNETYRALEGALDPGRPRSPYRERLQHLLLGPAKRPVVVTGAPGCGKSTVIARLIHDLIERDDYPTHRDLSRLHEVWRISGRRIIAGMSRVGDWEQRCIELASDARRRPVLLLADDLHTFGRLGQSRQSDRSLADFFRGPLARGELVMIGECTPEQLQRLEDDSPSFASLFTRVPVEPTTSSETLYMMLHEARSLEEQNALTFDPFTFRTILELTSDLFPRSAFPGKALDLLRGLATEAGLEATVAGRDRLDRSDRSDRAGDAPPREVTAEDVVSTLSRKTGLPEVMLQPSRRLPAEQVERYLGSRVLGQTEAIDAAVDLVLRIKAGLTDPDRPYGVYLFTGPTGTGKTELAGAIASYLYGSPGRLLRFDMSELSGPDAPARLIGDRWAPEGILTQRIQDQPFSVVLLDEIEKAHPAVLNLLLQLFDEGRLTDARGGLADFRKSVIIMTSNLGARHRAAVGFGGDSPDTILLDIARAVRDHFPPELFNRIDRVVPFRPLTAVVARRIAERALSRLVARRGLARRNIFVYANEGVFDHIVREAFDAEQGARPVKRWVERTLGALLTTEIVARGSDARLQLIRIHQAAGADTGFRLHVERLVEAEPLPGSSALEPMIDAPLAELERRLPEALAEVRRLLGSEALRGPPPPVTTTADAPSSSDATLEDGAAYEAVYRRESLRLHLERLEDALGRALERGEGRDPELLEAERFAYTETSDEGSSRQRVFDLRQMSPGSPPLTRDAVLDTLAEVYFLGRALPSLHDPDEHSVLIELLRVGRARDEATRLAPDGEEEPSLLQVLLESYLTGLPEGAAVERFAVRGEDGEVLDGAGPMDAGEPLLRGAEHAVLEVHGLFLRALLQDEQGSHVVRSLARGTELVRVRVWSSREGSPPRRVIEEHEERRRLFERALESGATALPPNPEELMPAVRVLQLEPAERGEATPWIVAEDYVLGHATRVRARGLGTVLSRLRRLVKSRSAPGPREPS